MEDKLAGLLGLARRAGRVTFGYDAVVKDTLAQKAVLILLAGDASPRTTKGIRQLAEENRVRAAALTAGKEELGRAIGRGDTAVAAITDKSFADGILKKCRESLREEDLLYDD